MLSGAVLSRSDDAAESKHPYHHPAASIATSPWHANVRAKGSDPSTPQLLRIREAVAPLRMTSANIRARATLVGKL
jgi:hypothetical protein